MKPDSSLSRKTRAICFGLLIVALGCNISVLFVPFMNFREVLSSEVYTMFTTVEMLWTEKLYALAVLVVGFSLLFPFFKLAVLLTVVLRRNHGPHLLRLLNRVEMLAKWSMLDVFLVCLVLTLTSGQVFVSASPRVGVPLFISAIVLSMAVGQVLAHRLLDRTANQRHFRMMSVQLKPWGRLLLVVLSGGLLFGALGLPFLKIESWFLVDQAFSIVTVIPALWEQGSYTGAVAVSLFLVMSPVIRWLILAIQTWKSFGQKKDARQKRIFEFARLWSMVDVFALAMGIFLIEGRRFVPADAEVGAALLVLLVFVGVMIERILEADSDGPHNPEQRKA
tara:strand:+ start:4231 stop:5238 length:1008 start_codon:yes stop_codon:yes gene_type:complete